VDVIKGLKTVEEINGTIFHFIFNNRRNLGMAFIRFQEHYDSPEFKNKCFTLDEFKAWYMKEKKSETFTYYTDWAGYNFPDTALTAFQEERFADLTDAENAILRWLNQVKGRFYVIGSVGRDDETFRHEMAHAFYYLEPEYREKAESIVKSYNTTPIKMWLEYRGYDDDVMIDEIQAYMSCNPSLILKPHAKEYYKTLIAETTELFENECRKISRRFSTLRTQLGVDTSPGMKCNLRGQPCLSI